MAKPDSKDIPVAALNQGTARDDLSAVHPGLVDEILKLLDTENIRELQNLIEPLHSSEKADLLETLHPDQRKHLIDLIHPHFEADVLSELDEMVREQVIDDMEAEEVAAAISEMDSDDAVDIIEDLEADVQQQVLKEMPIEDRVILEDHLTYPEESAGRLMQRELVAVPEHWTVGKIIDYMREDEDLPRDFYDIYVVDPAFRPIGSIPLSRILRTQRPMSAREIMDMQPRTLPAQTDQEDVARFFRDRNIVTAPVVNEKGRLIGVITIDDVVDVIDEEAEEDIMRMGGVVEDDFYGAVLETTRSRFTWLLVNLATAFLASTVIFMFEGAISKLVALAVLMPIVASMGGNAGTQTLTVAVRALAMKELNRTNALRAVTKELLVALANGVIFALISGLVSWWWFDDAMLGGIIAAAMMINIAVAGLAGTAIPLWLNRIGVDPAIASGTFLTTVTDVVGFLAFLGLAAWYLM